MRVRTEKGSTVCFFKDFAAVEPEVVKIRDDFRAKKIDKDKVTERVTALFGAYRFNADFDRIVGRLTGSPAIAAWDEWIGSQPIGHRKLYYSPEVVAGCVMGEDE
jgi:hypothetical protein